MLCSTYQEVVLLQDAQYFQPIHKNTCTGNHKSSHSRLVLVIPIQIVIAAATQIQTDHLSAVNNITRMDIHRYQ